MTWTFLHSPWQFPLGSVLHLFKFTQRTVMLCFLEGKIIPAITLQDEHICFHFKKNKRSCLALHSPHSHLAALQGSMLRQCQQGTSREVTTEHPHGPTVSQTALPWLSGGLQRVCQKGCPPSDHYSLPFPFSIAPLCWSSAPLYWSSVLCAQLNRRKC